MVSPLMADWKDQKQESGMVSKMMMIQHLQIGLQEGGKLTDTYSSSACCLHLGPHNLSTG